MTTFQEFEDLSAVYTEDVTLSAAEANLIFNALIQTHDQLEDNPDFYSGVTFAGVDLHEFLDDTIIKIEDLHNRVVDRMKEDHGEPTDDPLAYINQVTVNA